MEWYGVVWYGVVFARHVCTASIASVVSSFFLGQRRDAMRRHVQRRDGGGGVDLEDAECGFRVPDRIAHRALWIVDRGYASHISQLTYLLLYSTFTSGYVYIVFFTSISSQISSLRWHHGRGVDVAELQNCRMRMPVWLCRHILTAGTRTLV